MIYRIDKNDDSLNCIITIRLNDECKNGHQDFSLTATFWEVNKKRCDKNLGTAGCCHDKILKHFPELKIFKELHMCDHSGIPMYAVENGFYFLKNGFQTKKGELREQFCEYYRITEQQFDKLNKATSREEYADILQNTGILQQWKKQADKAIKLLEELTGDTFVVDSIKSNFHKAN